MAEEIRSVWDIRPRLEENFRRVERLLGEMEHESDAELSLAIAAEARQHIALAERALRAVCRMEEVRAFEDAVLEALDEADAGIRRKVVDRLNARAVDAGLLRPPE